MSWAIIGIDEYGNRRQICVEATQADAQNFIDSQRVATYTTSTGWLSNFSHHHILRGYVDAFIEQTDEQL